MIRASFPFAAQRRGGVAPEGGRPVGERDLARGPGHVDRGRIVEIRRRQRSSHGRGARLADEQVLPRRERAGELRQLPRVRTEVAGACSARVLERLAVQRDRDGAAVEDLDVVVREGRTRVPAATVDLADDEIRRRTVRERTPGRACEREERSDTHTGEREARADVTHRDSPLRRFEPDAPPTLGATGGHGAASLGTRQLRTLGRNPTATGQVRFEKAVSAPRPTYTEPDP